MPVISRKFDKNSDFEKVRVFLLHLFELTGSMHNWFPVRFENSYDRQVEDILIWEKGEGEGQTDKVEIVAVANPESERRYFIQIHPDYKFLEKEIIEWIENHSKMKKKDEKTEEKLFIHSRDGDQERESSLASRGFIKTKYTEIFRSRPVDLPVPDIKATDGYTVRVLNPIKDGINYLNIIKLVFKHDNFTEEVMKSLHKASFYIQDLDIVAIAPDGTIAAFCTLRLDPIGKIASLEPLGTHPDHRRKGLARIVLFEAIKRSEKYNPVYYVIEGAADTLEANKFYESTGYVDKTSFTAWMKEI